MLAAVALIAIAGRVSAQQSKIDEDGIKRKIAKSDADIENPKKNTKAATWIDRGNVMTEADDAPNLGLYKGSMNEEMSKLLLGTKGKSGSETFGDTKYNTYEIPDLVKVYYLDGAVWFWDPKVVIYPGALDKATEAYLKAVELDPKSTPKAKEGLNKVANLYKQYADRYYNMQKFKEASEAFKKAYLVSANAVVGAIDTASVFNAGYTSILANDFVNAADNLEIALKYNYYNEGDICFLLYHCYNSMQDSGKAKAILMDGVAKYPKNIKIIESLMAYFATTGEDPKEIIPIVEKAIADDPKNPDLYGGLGRIYDKMGDLDKAIESFARAVEVSPNDFGSNFNLGLLYIKKGDAANTELNQRTITNQQEYNDGLAKVYESFNNSIVPLEKAHSLDPKDVSTVELLKNVCFRLRDEPGVMDKYNKYNELLKTMKE